MPEIEFADLIPPDHWSRGFPCDEAQLVTLGFEAIDDVISAWRQKHVLEDDPRVQQLHAIRARLVKPRLSVLRGKHDFDPGMKVCIFVTDRIEYLCGEPPRWYDATIDECRYFSNGDHLIECITDEPTPRLREPSCISVVDQDPHLLLPEDRIYLAEHPDFAAVWVRAVAPVFLDPGRYDPDQLLQALRELP